MRKLTLTIFCLAASMAALSAGPLSGRRIPSFTLPDANANYHDILDYRGKVVLVEVMQTSCPHCQKLIPQLERVHEKYGSSVQVLSIVVPPDNADTVRQFAARFNIGFPILFDCGQVTASLVNATPSNPKVSFPHFFLVDKSGMIREDYEGAKDEVFLSGQGLFDSLDKLLASPQSTTSKAPVTPAK